jgi:hypothetical protein
MMSQYIESGVELQGREFDPEPEVPPLAISLHPEAVETRESTNARCIKPFLA